ncbi:MAG: DUF6816 family protein [Cyanobacteriota bacterium]
MVAVLGWLLLGAGAWPAQALPATDPLVVRLEQWPTWTLPAPVQRPGRSDLALPDWMLGTWELREDDLSASASPLTTAIAPQIASVPVPTVNVRFLRNSRGQVVGDRAFNALSLGRSVLGDTLLRVDNDPQNPNRQLARLRGDRLLESSVIGRARLTGDAGTFLADELTLQILHGPGQPQISQVEVLALYRRQADGVTIEQWQASYGAPGEGAEGRRSSHRLLLLQRSAEG